MALRIHALSVGRVFGLQKPTFTYLRGWGETMDCPLIMFVIQGGEHPIVVDTGADPVRAAEVHHIRMEQRPDETPTAALASVGIDPADVRQVVNTHLHWDHSSNNDLFPNADVLIQRAELDFAREPVTWHRRNFEVFDDLPASWRKAEERVRPVDGRLRIADGVTLVPLPGHTPGSQGVLVETASGPHLIAGDCIYTDLIAYEQSLRAIEELDCVIIPGHDLRVLERGVFE